LLFLEYREYDIIFKNIGSVKNGLGFMDTNP